MNIHYFPLQDYKLLLQTHFLLANKGELLQPCITNKQSKNSNKTDEEKT